MTNQEAIQYIRNAAWLGSNKDRDKIEEAVEIAVNAINGIQSAQPEIIRCKDCKHKGTKNCVANAWTTIFGFGVKDDFYCGLAERRTE